MKRLGRAGTCYARRGGREQIWRAKTFAWCGAALGLRVWGRSIDRDAHLKGIRERSSYDASQNICARNAGTSSAR
jgi:hypothetical protein